MLVAPPVLVGIVLGANQTRAGAYMPWLLSIAYWVSISLVTWWLLALGTYLARFLMRPWSPPEWLGWLVGAIAGSLAARPVIYAVAYIFLPFMQEPVLREMLPTAPTLEFLRHYLTNWSVIIIMWMAACWLEAKWRRIAPAQETGKAPQEATALSQQARLWENDAFLSRIPPALGREILALHSEDHYVRVYTGQGDALILAAISDAVRGAEAGGCAGVRVHRSWWVANGAVSASHLRGRKMIVLLTNGLEVPVSQTYRELARMSGMLSAA